MKIGGGIEDGWGGRDYGVGRGLRGAFLSGSTDFQELMKKSGLSHDLLNGTDSASKGQPGQRRRCWWVVLIYEIFLVHPQLEVFPNLFGSPPDIMLLLLLFHALLASHPCTAYIEVVD